MPLNWGIIGTGKIASDFVNSLAFVDGKLSTLAHLTLSGTKVVAVGSRHLESADKFGQEHNIPNRYGSYSDVAADPLVNAIYVSVLHPGHKEAALMAINNGKHVLCEKPLTINASEAEVIIHAAREKKVLLMEAMWTRFVPAYQKIRELLASKAIGEVCLTTVDFGFASTKDRLVDLNLGGGATLDIGVYVVSLASMVYGGDSPSSIYATGDLLESGADCLVGITLKYKPRQIAQMSLSLLAKTPSVAVISGTHGNIKIHAPFHTPTKITVTIEGKEQDYEFPIEAPKPNQHYNFTNSVNLQFEARHFQSLVERGLTDSDVMPIAESLVIMKTLDEIRKQVGVVYPSEK
eukprot:TRINITY_DN1772_c1_g1_i3.p2 TRINITY_DN1772_c1_g1~~TRINITY_DN1772_c1_g1_i3.p2  ORF type:complete len:349 (+),score=37.90 TRINITY_DN1772_c1_g1_i3:684-1730(+)